MDVRVLVTPRTPTTRELFPLNAGDPPKAVTAIGNDGNRYNFHIQTDNDGA
jgi:hypothetical protein